MCFFLYSHWPQKALFTLSGVFYFVDSFSTRCSAFVVSMACTSAARCRPSPKVAVSVFPRRSTLHSLQPVCGPSVSASASIHDARSLARRATECPACSLFSRSVSSAPTGNSELDAARKLLIFWDPRSSPLPEMAPRGLSGTEMAPRDGTAEIGQSPDVRQTLLPVN